jgi:predicted aspartyl protease
MPHLTLQIVSGGPLVDIKVGVSQERENALQRAGQPIPAPVQLRAVIDTGASCTCVDPQALLSLALTATGTTPIHTPSTQGIAHDAASYDVSITLMHPELDLWLGTVPIVESQLGLMGIQALLGRDVLESCLLVYNGETGFFTLAF